MCYDNKERMMHLFPHSFLRRTKRKRQVCTETGKRFLQTQPTARPTGGETSAPSMDHETPSSRLGGYASSLPPRLETHRALTHGGQPESAGTQIGAENL